jgi:hypothetical protein
LRYPSFWLYALDLNVSLAFGFRVKPGMTIALSVILALCLKSKRLHCFCHAEASVARAQHLCWLLGDLDPEHCLRQSQDDVGDWQSQDDVGDWQSQDDVGMGFSQDDVGMV